MDPAEGSVLGTVVELARRLLDDPALGPTDNFFERGGDSLTAVDLCAELEESYEVEMPLELVWETDSFDQLANRVEAMLMPAV